MSVDGTATETKARLALQSLAAILERRIGPPTDGRAAPARDVWDGFMEFATAPLPGVDALEDYLQVSFGAEHATCSCSRILDVDDDDGYDIGIRVGIEMTFEPVGGGDELFDLEGPAGPEPRAPFIADDPQDPDASRTLEELVVAVEASPIWPLLSQGCKVSLRLNFV